ncbi:hypothetical protein DM50_3671 [Burkholderia mallei]|nr:hypothetical protein BG19_5924 [Burkholderia pseudomallei MSHR840]KGC70990.1 hypothetical protein DM75_3363 [Burkholderia mallei]KOS85357.1 hypothetical protein DM45_2884 [Burkholderia mallei]KOT02960.1 hypothetical protein DM50_3671 [Burkholderia mallei]
MKIVIITVRLRYGGTHMSANRPRGAMGSAGAGGGSGRPYSASTFASSAASTRSASSSRPCCASQRGLSGNWRRIHQTKIAPCAPISTTQRQPSRPNGACGTSRYASSATTGTATKPTACSHANARPRICFGTNSERYVPIVTISTPSPSPTTKRQKLRPPAVSWNAITTFAAVYHSSDHVNTARRPKRSARKPHAIVPMKSPANSAAMKLATPVVPNSPRVVALRMPPFTRPGAT